MQVTKWTIFRKLQKQKRSQKGVEEAVLEQLDPAESKAF